MPDRLIVGMMSGTSADGVDAALVRISGSGLQMRAERIEFASQPFPEALRREILAVRSEGSATLRGLCELTRSITEQYVACARMLPLAGVVAVAAHGQTLFHDPPLTLQVFDPALLAQSCGIDVISDFRRADCAMGGQGAPLVPFADYVLFRSDAEDRVIVNIGGISNVTLLPRACAVDDVIGFDTGPGNCLSDWILGAVDVGGARAVSGKPLEDAAATFLASEYIRRSAPKSTDGPAMIAAFKDAVGSREASTEDLLATSAEIVAQCILRQTPDRSTLIVAGGGVHNEAIMARLRASRRVVQTDSFGVPAQAREAIAFAILGAATLDRVPANIPRVTGARKKVFLGAISPVGCDSSHHVRSAAHMVR